MHIILVFCILVFGFREASATSLFSCPRLPVPSSSPQNNDPAIREYPCGCNTTTVWNDVMFVFDTSEATGTYHLYDLIATFQTLTSAYTIADTSSNEPMVMRAGIVTYASNATVVVPLGDLTAEMIEPLQLNISRNDYKTNIKDAITAAMGELNGPNHRLFSTQVIVILATTFNPSGEDSPCVIADKFKEDGGVIITYDYLTSEGNDGSLEELASPAYAFNSSMRTQEEFEDFQKSQCPANCKCMNNYKPYGKHYAPEYPLGGCYWPTNTPSNEALAAKRCGQPPAQGTLTKIESEAKQQFLTSLFVPTRSYFIGATYESSSDSWFWPDNTLVNYTNWCGAAPTDFLTPCAVAKLESNFCWQATSCRNVYTYICEGPPCDSTHYCGEE